MKIDNIELQEWIDSIDGVVHAQSTEYAQELLQEVSKRLKQHGGTFGGSFTTDYVNTIAPEKQVPYQGLLDLEKTISNYIRWNAAVMVVKANKNNSELGGHISSYASSSTLYEVGMNHFWKSTNDSTVSDIVFFQGHSSPGIYARSFLEGRFSKEQLSNFRQEAFSAGLSSYPHPWLMPDYWQFATVSMGLGPLMAIYQARFMRYLENREIANTSGRKVWCFIGDGETSEPETLGNIHIASRDKLSNLIFVINCNLQRLDGPVNGNGKIIQDLEGLFAGAGWRVIKCIWSSAWDDLLLRDTSGKLKQLLLETLDGDYQNLRSKDGAYIRKNFFGKTPETLALVENLTDDEIWNNLIPGGHDSSKVYAAYHEAVNNVSDKPVVILAHTIKGFGLASSGESRNVAHNTKKLSIEALKNLRDVLELPINDDKIEEMPFLSFASDSKEYQYLLERRNALGGWFPIRKPVKSTLKVPELSAFENVLASTEDKEMSTTMAFVRILNTLVKDKEIGKFIVPIVPDESRTFGMEGMFRQIGIFSVVGQLYTPEDASQLMFYKEDKRGQILQEGINEAGAMSSWIAAATSYANHGAVTVPFYVYYSMFGFQRIGDQAWASGDMRARGFLCGAVAGRTTLNGEGLQHEDGHSHIQAGLIPNCESYDPTFAHELAVIIQHGLHEMYVENKDKFYYITMMNETYTHPGLQKGSEKDIIAGAYLFKSVDAPNSKLTVNLLGSGTIFRESIAASEILAQEFGISSKLFSVPSYNKLRRNGMDSMRHNMHYPDEVKVPFITELLNKNSTASVTVSATDYIRNYADQIREYIPHTYIVLGTDGFGRSDLRSNLRRFFEVDRYYIVLAALSGLVKSKQLDVKILKDMIKKYNIDCTRLNPWEI